MSLHKSDYMLPTELLNPDQPRCLHRSSIGIIRHGSSIVSLRIIRQNHGCCSASVPAPICVADRDLQAVQLPMHPQGILSQKYHAGKGSMTCDTEYRADCKAAPTLSLGRLYNSSLDKLSCHLGVREVHSIDWDSKGCTYKSGDGHAPLQFLVLDLQAWCTVRHTSHDDENDRQVSSLSKMAYKWAYIPCLVHVLCMYVVGFLHSRETTFIDMLYPSVKKPGAMSLVVPFLNVPSYTALGPAILNGLGR